MTPMQRVLTAMGHEEPDRVPVFILTTLHGAKELGLSIRDYFSRAEHIAEGQLRLQQKYRSDCLYAFCYAALELEAFGGETIFIDDGPPNAAAPVLRRGEDIDRLEPPRPGDCAGLNRTLEAIRRLKDRVGDAVPIVGSVIAPFSLPVMQLGFEQYIELLYGDPERFTRLMAVNQRFCVDWANAQLAAGATAIGYDDPLASPTYIPRELYLKTGHRVAMATLAQIKGPTAMHLASGRGLAIADDIVITGASALGVSTLEDLADWKSAVGPRLTLIGNLNGIEMRRWTGADAEREVKQAIAKAGRGGGFILADNHGEIPWQVPDEVLLAIRAAVDRWGRYPLEWIE
ncbi:MAG: methylcobamide--CoM methyltransferase MtbA [Methylococcaceae bacterium]|nr:methylcobamide--CoM methyltransferase MtbA [Methylococcaceae bacterium]